MELKVWVDDIQRVVCGITEQTTVQEVVIALAQATGRTGRYTLVERWRTMEKMLPPTEHPLQVLARWGERAKEVQFVLRRTGASSVSEADEGNVVAPERSTYRQSLPPQLKHKQKKEAILNRKEPKRKSLTIPGGGAHDNSSSTKYNSVVVGDRKDEQIAGRVSSGNAMQASPKKALIPPAFRNQAPQSQKVPISEQKNTSSAIKEPLMPPQQPYRHTPTPIPSSPTRKALMPPQMRNDYILKTSAQPSSQGRPANGGRYISHEHRTSNGSDNSGPASPQKRVVEPHAKKAAAHSKSSESAKARAEFTRLVLEQQEHVNEQSQTLKSLDKEMEKFQSLMQSRERNTLMMKKEIETLERTVRANEADLLNDEILQQQLQQEGLKGNSLQTENAKFQSELTSTNENIKELQKKIVFLQKEIEREANLQEQRNKEMAKNRLEATELNLRRANLNVRKVMAELEKTEDGINKNEAVVYEKQIKLEALNRELRQVNLQQFIRQTGSKVTVLPPDLDKNAMDHDQLTALTHYNPAPESKPVATTRSEPGGVWV